MLQSIKRALAFTLINLVALRWLLSLFSRAESSIWWTTGTTGDGASTYTESQLTTFFGDLFTPNTTITAPHATMGVLLGVGGELAVTGSSSPVSVATGAAITEGYAYRNTAAVTVAIPTPASATRIDRIVLRVSHSTTRTVRITRIAGTEGTGTPPSITQVAGTTWDIKLCQVSITTGGVCTVTDERAFIYFATKVSTAMLDDAGVTTAKIADNGVSNAKLRDSAALSVIGRATNSSGDPADIASSVDDTIPARMSSALSWTQVITQLIANDAVDDTKVGNRVPQLYRRQGGSATNWWTGGTSTQTPTAVRIQVGTIALGNQAAGSGGSGSVTFPTAFSNVPFVMIAGSPHLVVAGLLRAGTSVAAPTASGFDYEFQNNGGSTQAAYLTWIAIGPE